MKRAAVILILVAFAACGGAQYTDKAASGVNLALGATNASRDAFTAWDKLHQQDLVASSSTKEQADAKLAHYRAQRQPVEKAFLVAYTAIAAAASAVVVVQLGGKPDRDLRLILGEVMKAALDVKAAIEAVQKDPKGGV